MATKRKKSNEERAANVDTQLRLILADAMDMLLSKQRRAQLAMKLAAAIEDTPLIRIEELITLLQKDPERTPKAGGNDKGVNINIASLGETYLSALKERKAPKLIEGE